MNYLQTYQQSRGLAPDGVIGKQTAKAMMNDLGIASTVEFCHFIAQIEHESGHFKFGRENLKYGATGLQKTFGKYFEKGEIASFANNAEKIANKVYANRMGNGIESSGDGFKYRGAGALQLTGKNNIQQYFKHVGLPPLSDPTLLTTPEHYFKTARWFFDINNVWQYCQKADELSIIKTSKKINLGNADSIRKPNGLDERLKLTNHYFKTLM